jgi:hypothetical protein
MMAGAEAIRSGAPAALALSRTDLAERVADRERNRLNQLARVWQLPEKPVAPCGTGAQRRLVLDETEHGAMLVRVGPRQRRQITCFSGDTRRSK